MRLLNCTTFQLTDFPSNALPPYAILSHTWHAEEVLVDDMRNGTFAEKAGFRKLKFCARQAATEKIDYFWMDTCCIDKASSSELSEAVNSSFRWYRNATICYVYLIDVSASTSMHNGVPLWENEFRNSRWFTRGWTLQELLAPRMIQFFSEDGTLLGTKHSLEQHIHEVTKIPIAALRGQPLSEFSVEARMRWTQSRTTTREEDTAYCLLGIFDVSMPLLYGEGPKALIRLKNEINSRYVVKTPSGPPQSAGKRKLVDEKPNVPLEQLHYNPLGSSKFRLLNIDPASMGDMLTAYIHEYDLADLPVYYTLSYVWGQEPPIIRTVINGQEHWIRPNLFHALQRVRLQEGLTSIWVDDVCINQKDSSERSLQVSQMARIYDGAIGAVIWLGEEDSTSKPAFEFIREITSEGFRWDEEWCQGHGFAALARLFERTWFRRGWVLQEAAFSKNSIIQCGEQQIHMDYFTTAIRTIRDRLGTVSLSSDLMLISARDSPAMRFMDIVSSALGGHAQGAVPRCRMSLETLVHRTVYSETTDQRDTIYALLNLANDVRSYPSLRQYHFETVVPNYEKPVLDVFVDFILHCCDRSRRLDIICRPWAPVLSASVQTSYQATYTNTNLRKYPTWIAPRVKLPFGNPSWRLRNRLHGDPLVARSDRGCYHTHYGLRPQVSVGRTEEGHCDGTLQTKGLVIGEIVDRSARMADGIISKECINILRSRSDIQEPRSDELPDVIWRALCADRDDKGDRAPYSYHDAMLHLLRIDSDERYHGDTFSLLETMSSIDAEELLDTGLPEYVEQFLRVTRDIVWNRRTFRLKRRNSRNDILVGLAPQYAKVGDQVCILYGCSVPVVLRRLPHAHGIPSWSLIGDAYVHGIMDGEVISSSTPEMLRSQEIDFRIV